MTRRNAWACAALTVVLTVTPLALARGTGLSEATNVSLDQAYVISANSQNALWKALFQAHLRRDYQSAARQIDQIAWTADALAECRKRSADWVDASARDPAAVAAAATLGVAIVSASLQQEAGGWGSEDPARQGRDRESRDGARGALIVWDQEAIDAVHGRPPAPFVRAWYLASVAALEALDVGVPLETTVRLAPPSALWEPGSLARPCVDCLAATPSWSRWCTWGAPRLNSRAIHVWLSPKPKPRNSRKRAVLTWRLGASSASRLPRPHPS